MKIYPDKTKYHLYAFDFEFSNDLLEFCRYLKKELGDVAFTFYDKQWRFNDMKAIEIIKGRYPETTVDPVVLIKYEMYMAEQEKEMMAMMRSHTVKNAEDSSIEIKGIKGSLYPYQKVGVEFFVVNNGRAILADQMGTGKTLQSLAYVTTTDKKKTLIVCPASVKYSWEAEVKKWTRLKTLVIDSQTALSPLEYSQYDVFIINYDILKRHFNALYAFQWDCLICDECFTGETEVLTDNGFIRFDRLTKKEKIAQWDDGEISFVNPLRYIKRLHDGPMVNFTVKHNVTVPMTPGHEQVLINRRSRKVVKKAISDIDFSCSWRLPVSGLSTEKSGRLSALERLYIATQADGSIHSISPRTKREHCLISFSFVKDSKIKRIKRLAKDAGVELTDVKCSPRHRKRFLLRMPLDVTKDIRNHIKFPMSAEKAKEVIEEMVLWDGHKSSKTSYYFSSKDKTQADFYAAVAVIAGHRIYQSIEKDDRKDSYSDIHRLFILLDRKDEDTQKCHKEIVDYTGYVYCVEVPSGAIIVRHNGFAFVSGNCHYIKNQKAQRTKLARIIASRIQSVLLLSGTPLLSRPIELFTALNIIHPTVWNNYMHYSRRYCGGHQGYFGWDERGATNIPELQSKISRYFIRRLKTDVLKELPPKQYTDIPVVLSPDYRRQYNLAMDDFKDYLKRIKKKTDKEINKSMAAEKLVRLSALRQITTMGKLQHALEMIKDIVDSGEKVVVFSVYNEPLNILKKALGKSAVLLTGMVDAKDRRDMINTFQNDSETTVFLGGTKAAGAGITLTSAPNVLFIDYSWVPADHDQAADRIHRIGQTAESVNIYQLYSKDTIDDYMAKLLEGKKAIFDKLIENKDTNISEMNITNNLIKIIEKQ